VHHDAAVEVGESFMDIVGGDGERLHDVPFYPMTGNEWDSIQSGRSPFRRAGSTRRKILLSGKARPTKPK
jgi:hypothetical protein